MQHAVEIRILSVGPNSTRSWRSSAEENRINTGTYLYRGDDSDSKEEKSHQAPSEMRIN